MSLETMPRWVRYAERGFAFHFIAFSFVMFSCWFPTGFSATFSTFAFLFALPIFGYRIRALELNPFEKAGLVLFGWLLLSVFWSDAPLTESLGYLSEYRIYFMLPVLIAALSLNEKTQRFAFFAAMIGAFIALVTSYGLGLGWWEIEGAKNSLANRIYHGFIMSSFLLACLLIARTSNGWMRAAAICVSLLAIYNVLNIETGRTGYLQIIAVCITFALLTCPRIKAVLIVASMVFLFGISYVTFDRFQDQVNLTFANFEKVITADDYQSGVGHRLEYYRGAIKIGLDYPFTGVGVGDATSTLLARAEAGEIRLLTDNVHSEFLNMFVIGGFPGLVLFVGVIASVMFSGIMMRPRSTFVGGFLVGLAVIIGVSALFNSTIKDYGEKHALIIMLSILGAHRGLNKRSQGDVIRPVKAESI